MEISPITGKITGTSINPENTWCVVIQRTGEVIARFRSRGSAYTFKNQHSKDYFEDIEVRKIEK